VHSGHEAFLDSEVIVNDLGDGCQAVSGARRVGHDLHRLVVFGMVDAHDKHRRRVGALGRGGDNHLFGAYQPSNNVHAQAFVDGDAISDFLSRFFAFEMLCGLFSRSENASGLHDVLHV